MAAGKRNSRLRRQARQTGHAVESGAHTVEGKIKKGASSPWLARTARLGYIIRGLLYGAMGVFGVGFSVGIWHQTTDQRGALYLVRTLPVLEVVLLGVVIVGLAGYSAWGFIRAVYDPLNRGDEAAGIAARLGFAWSGLSYAGLLLFTVQFLLGLSKGGGSDTIERTVRFVMAHPFGVILTGIAGAIAVLVGLGQFVDAYKAGFRKDLQRQKMSKQEEAVADSLGRFGMFSRGVIFTLLGWFVVLAAIHHDAAQAHGMGAVFQDIARQPYGHLMLFVVSAGFIALGLHSMACAKWIRMSPRS
ncbi:MAG TPA: DUF1206 domain-containing protein [Candidatus Dormibacteraeota bacterium]